MNVAIVGASGAVGQELLKVLEQRNFPIENLYLFGSERSAGQSFSFRGVKHEVRLLRKDSKLFDGVDISFCSAGGTVSKEYADTITSGGGLMIDNSNAFRMDVDVPLVVPEVNAEDALQRPRKIIANPNCTTIQMVVALKAIEELSHILRVHVATYQAASGAGTTGMNELVAQAESLARKEDPVVEKFSSQLMYNLIPQVDVFMDNDYTREEMKMYHETRKIMHSDVAVCATCVRVPVMRAHSEAIWVETQTELSVEAVRQAFANASGITLVDDPRSTKYPMPLFVAEQDDVFVGRIRKDLANPRGLTFWCVADQIRKGAALNAVQIAEWLLANDAQYAGN